MTMADSETLRARHETPWRYWLWLGAAGTAISLTVGTVPAVLAMGILLADRYVFPDKRLVASAAFGALVVLPFVWFLGSSLPLMPPAPRIQDNTWAHQVGGLAVWLLFIVPWVDRAAESTGRDAAARDLEPPPAASQQTLPTTEDFHS